MTGNRRYTGCWDGGPAVVLGPVHVCPEAAGGSHLLRAVCVCLGCQRAAGYSYSQALQPWAGIAATVSRAARSLWLALHITGTKQIV